jgi:pyroglutamyl-peptidase
MVPKLLLTSFDTWLPHQPSNSSNDLLNEINQRNSLPKNCDLLQKLPVDFQLAPQQVVTKIHELQPDLIICCGMAESRSFLTLESNGKYEDDIIHTALPLEQFTQELKMTHISHDAGNFVCNYLYYSVLKLLQEKQLNHQCLFVHVPILNQDNLEAIVADFLKLLHQLRNFHKNSESPS